MRGNYVVIFMLFLGLGGTSIGHADSGAAEDLLARGRALYHGQTPFSGVVRAGHIILPSSAGACANCHGLSGEGSREGGVTVPGIAWARLSQPQRGKSEYGSAREVLDAIETGRGREGTHLQSPMPAVALTTEEETALLAYLQVIGTERESVQGVSDDRILLGAMMPLTPAGSYGEQIRAGLEERFAAINREGGIFGRRIELVVEDSGRHGTDVARALDRLATRHRVFALVGSVVPELSPELSDAIRRQDLPIVATLGVAIQDSTASNLTYLLPSVAEQLTQLIKEVKSHCNAESGIAVLHEPRQALAEAVETAVANEPSIRLIRMNRVDLDRRSEEWSRLAASPSIVLGSEGFVAQVRAKAVAASNDAGTCLATLAMLSGIPPMAKLGRMGGDTSIGLPEVIGLPMPVGGMRLQQQFQGGALWSYLADLSARTIAEVLSRSGRVLNYASFNRSLYSLHGFEPDEGLPIQYSLQHRHGLSVAHLWGRTQHADK